MPMPGPADRGGAALAAEGEAIDVEEPSTLAVQSKRTVAGQRHDRGLAAGSHPSWSSTRRATADEAKNLR